MLYLSLAESDHGRFEGSKSKKKVKLPEIALPSVIENPFSAESSGTLSANGEFESSFQNLRKLSMHIPVYGSFLAYYTKICFHILGDLDAINEEDPPHTSTIVFNIDVGGGDDKNGFENTQL